MKKIIFQTQRKHLKRVLKTSVFYIKLTKAVQLQFTLITACTHNKNLDPVMQGINITMIT